MRRFTKALPVLMVVLLAAFALVFVACEPAEEEVAATNPTDNPWTEGEDLSGTEVELFGAFVDTDAQNFQASMEPFIEQTGIDVVYEGSGDFEALITVRAEGGDPPDIAAFPQPGLMYDLVDGGHLVDVLSFMDRDYLEGQYAEDWLAIAEHGGIMAGVWYRASVKSLVWYSPHLFEEEGYEIPETWDELIALSDQMVADGHNPWSIGIESAGATGWVATDWIEDIMLRTAPPEAYDDWVTGDLPFASDEVRNAINYMSEIWLNDDYVLGGTTSILTVPFGDAINPIVMDPPRAAMHRQAQFILGFLPEGQDIEIGTDLDIFYFPMIDEEYGEPVLTAGDVFGMMQDRPEVRAVMRYLTQGESTRAWLEYGGFVSPHEDTPLDWYPTDLDRGIAEIMLEADTVRFDASDMMPGAVGTGSFWTGMVDYIQGDDLDTVLQRIDDSWPED